MRFLKKYWPTVLVFLAIIWAAPFILQLDFTPHEHEVIYNVTTPTKIIRIPTNQTTVVKQTDPPSPHPHDNSDDEPYDWRTDDHVNIEVEIAPWQQTFAKEQNEETVDDEAEKEEPYPPKDWENTKDLVLRAQYLYDVLMIQFGDIAEVHAIGEYETKIAEGTAPTVEEYISFLEAHQKLFPSEQKRELLDEVLKIQSEGGNIVFFME